MAPQLSKDLRDCVVKWRVDHGYTYRKLSQLAGCSIGTIANILAYHNLYGTSVNPFRHYPGRPRLLDSQDRAYVDELLHREPTIYLDEIQLKLYEDRDPQEWEARNRRCLVVGVYIVELEHLLKHLSARQSEESDGCSSL